MTDLRQIERETATNAYVAELRADNARLRAIIARAKDALLDGQSTQWVHDVLVQGLTDRQVLEEKSNG